MRCRFWLMAEISVRAASTFNAISCALSRSRRAVSRTWSSVCCTAVLCCCNTSRRSFRVLISCSACSSFCCDCVVSDCAVSICAWCSVTSLTITCSRARICSIRAFCPAIRASISACWRLTCCDCSCMSSRCASCSFSWDRSAASVCSSSANAAVRAAISCCNCCMSFSRCKTLDCWSTSLA